MYTCTCSCTVLVLVVSCTCTCSCSCTVSVMANHGPSYGLSRECQMKSQAKFSLERAAEALLWLEDVIGRKLEIPDPSHGLRDQLDFHHTIKDGTAICELINELYSGSVRKMNKCSSPFKQRENIEMFLKACEAYGMKNQDLFQVNDLYEHKNLYMVVDCLFALGGMAQKQGYRGPLFGVKVADENKRMFSAKQLAESSKIIGLQYGSNKGASQAGMTAYGTGRQIIPENSIAFHKGQ